MFCSLPAEKRRKSPDWTCKVNENTMRKLDAIGKYFGKEQFAVV